MFPLCFSYLPERKDTRHADARAGRLARRPAHDRGNPGRLRSGPASGRLAGSTGRNRIIGEYRSGASRLTLLLAGTTMVACPEALRMQERGLF